MNILSIIPEKIKTAGRTLFNGKATGTSDAVGVKPTTGSQSLMIVCLVTMANAADLVLSIVSGDDADGTNPVAITENIPIFLDDVRQTDAKTHTIADDSGSFVVVFCVPSILIPAGKYMCLSFADSNAANILSAIALDDSYHEMGPSA
jgi:hypothetical protein